MSKKYSKRALALAISVLAAGSGSIYAAPIRFDNLPGPGHYEWGDTVGGPNWYLDIALPAESQGALQAEQSSFYHTNFDPSDIGAAKVAGRVHVGGDFGVFAVGLNLGESIPAAYAWDASGFVYFEAFGTALPEGVPTYLGLGFNPGDGQHYGWIGVVREGHQLDAFAWGYETLPDVPIAAGVPEPTSLSLIFLAAAGIVARRRR